MRRGVTAVLKDVRERLTAPERWCKGANAKDKDGWGVPFDSEYACKWCLNGAFAAAYRSYYATDAAREILRLALPPKVFIAQFNDAKGTTHEDIMLVLDAAIGIAEAEDELEQRT